MDCEHTVRWLPLLVDREGGPWRRWRLRAHVQRCAGCAAKLEEMRAMRGALRDKLAYHEAPAGLAARIGAALAHEAAPMPALVRRRRPVPPRAFGFAGSGLAGALAAVGLMLLVQGGGPGQTPLLGAVIDSHVRSLMADHLTDVQTSDRHTVKPWLSHHIDVSPPVKELASEGFPLVGGRLDYIDGHPAAVVVYRHAKHVINLFAWASSGADAPLRTEVRQGFNIVRWRKDGIAYAAVSDVEADQLMAFARDVQQG